MRWIAPGSFAMGSPVEEAHDDETQHHVTLTRGFWFADSACTQALWQEVTGRNPSRHTEDPRIPVEQVSFDDVQGFLTQLCGRFQGVRFALPTEAQREYACRAGTVDAYGGVDHNALDTVAWFGTSNTDTIHPVKQLAANAWGLYDMQGNVFEWCADRYGAYPLSPVSDPVGPATGLAMVIRGGSWRSGSDRCRTSSRQRLEPNRRNDYLGFRICVP